RVPRELQEVAALGALVADGRLRAIVEALIGGGHQAVAEVEGAVLPEDDLEVQVAHVAVAIEADVAPLDDQALAAIILPELVEDLAARTVVRGDGGPERRQV